MNDERYALANMMGANMMVPEIPETALARVAPNLAARVLLLDIEKRYYAQGLAIGGSIVNTYLGSASQQAVDALDAVRIEPEARSSFFGPKGMNIFFRRGR